MNETPPADPAAMLSMLVTEHTALQTARSGTIFEANGRITLYLSAVSGALVALGFIGQGSDVRTPFFLFTLLLFPPLLFVGVVTYLRVLQVALEDTLYLWGINRIRHYYLERAPELARYFILSRHDDWEGMHNNMGSSRSWLNLLLTTAGMVSVVNSVLAGVLGGVGLHLLTGARLAGSIVAGALMFAVVLVLHTMHQIRRWSTLDRRYPPEFPSEAGDRTNPLT